VVVAKLHDLPGWPTIDRTCVILRVVVMHNEEGMFYLKVASTSQYRLIHKVLLDSSVQPLMLGKTIINGFGLINVNLDPAHIKF
jgi:hypothetical protein